MAMDNDTMNGGGGVEMTALAIPVLPEGYARVSVHWQRKEYVLPDPMPFGATADQVLRAAQEAARNIPGLENVELTDFHVDPINADDKVPFPRLYVRPKTPFGR